MVSEDTLWLEELLGFQLDARWRLDGPADGDSSLCDSS